MQGLPSYQAYVGGKSFPFFGRYIYVRMCYVSTMAGVAGPVNK